MSQIIGYMLTWTTYGSWLPGDERGYVKAGQILPANPQVLKASKKRQKSPPVKLNKQEIKLVQQVILTEAERIGHNIPALSVRNNHVHLVLLPHSESIEDTAGRYKSITTRALWKLGRKGRIWTKGYDKRFCFSEKELVTRIKYVQNHLFD
jgi:REP element-mobilizing transposase RayT